MASDTQRPLEYSSAEAIERFERAATASVPGREHAMRMAAALLAASVPQGGSILSVGVGSGLELSLLGSIRSDWMLTGIDPSAAMVEAARSRLTHDGMIDRTSLVVGLTDQLPETPAFDGATCIMVLPILPDNGAKGAFLASIGARLKPGGRLVFVSPVTEEAQTEMGPAWRWFQRGMGQSDAEIDALAGQVQREIQLVSEDRLGTLAIEAGFHPPKRFYQAMWFGGWFAEKRSAD